MRKSWAALGALLACALGSRAAEAPLTLERIMADPDWIGTPVSDPYWSADGRSAYYSQKRGGSPLIDLHRIVLASGKDEIIDDRERANADAPAVYDAAGRRAAFVRDGNVFVRELAGGKLKQITRGTEAGSAPQFSADGRLLSFRMGHDWWVYDFAAGVAAPAAIVNAEKDPNGAPEADDLRDFQLRTFATLRRLHEEADLIRRHAQAERKADATRAPEPFYLGDDVTIVDTVLSPDARWLVVVTAPKAPKGRVGQLTRYVTESGYEEFEPERARVGRGPPLTQSLLLLDLLDHSVHPLKIDELPGIHEDPLRAVREENSKLHAWVKPDAANDGKPRAVWVASEDPDETTAGIVWSRDSRSLLIEIFSSDNKDRWLATVDFAHYALKSEHRLSDAAWVNHWTFNAAGWLNDGRTLWFESEESGFAHLYIKKPGDAPVALTQGRFEVSHPALSPDGRWFYVLSNAVAPYSYDVYRVPSAGGVLERVTRLKGVESFALEHRGAQLLVAHSSPYLPLQLAVGAADGRGRLRELTDTRTPEYRSLSWLQPEIVQVPSTHGAGVIYAKLYRDPNAPPDERRPGVLFVHGAGYTQDVHLRFPYYFREQMFNDLLVQHGYVVLDLDYRASQGYGRDWRTAIYRQMGHPELEDLLDGKRWLVEHARVDARRVGIYGGSYGGFMTLMALFRAPGEFVAGAALRPVTDWMQYDQGYTAAILNDPKIDPIAYERSSPIEFAQGLKDRLLICHGVIDDNVLFEDSMRLYERLIELHKDNFAMSVYPLDRHGFTNADSWLDEYKRIYALFEANLRAAPSGGNM